MKELLSLPKSILLALSLFFLTFIAQASSGVSISIVSHTNVYCYGASTGSATASISGGVGPFAYSWTPSGGHNLTANGLAAGNYTCTVTDSSNMSTASAVAYISQPPQLVLTTTVTPSACMIPCNGSVQAIISGGTSVYTYSWAGMGTAATITNVCAGTSYTVTVTDQNACTATASGVMSSTDSMTATVSSINTGCNTNTGSVTANVVKGSLPYTYSWSTGQSTPSLNNLPTGVYTLQVQDHSGCAIVLSGTVANSSGLGVTMTKFNVTCFGLSTGSANMHPSGGQTPYTYSWSPSGGNAVTATGLSAGTYTAFCTDANGCIFQSILPINQPAQLAATVTTNPSGCGACNGNATANVSGGTGPYTYSWSPVSGSGSYCLSLCAGSYTCQVSDAHNCPVSASGSVASSSSMTASVSNTASGCTTCSGTASVTASGGHLPYTYSWSNSQTTQSLTGLCPVTYSVSIKDSNGCTFLLQTIIPNASGLVAAPSATNTTCWNNNNGTATANASGAVPPYTYSWSPGGMTTSSVSNLSPGHYTVFVTDHTGCSINSSVSLGHSQYIYVSLSSTPDNCNTHTGSATVTAFGGNPPYTYSWSSGATTQTATGLGTGPNSVVITDYSGCTSSGSTNVGTTCYDIIRGTVWNDPNLNCIYDSIDHHVAGRCIYTVPGNYYGYTDTAGRYTIWVPTIGNYTVYAAGVSNYVYHCPTPVSHLVSFTVIPDTSNTNDFAGHKVSPISPTPDSVRDLTVYMSSGLARPGFPISYSIYYFNYGNIPINATLTFTHDAQLTGFSANLTPSSYTSPTATWNLGILNPGQHGTISVTMQVPTLSSTACIGCFLTSTAVINPISGDAYPSDNTATDKTVIQGSFDPNFKECQTPGEDYSTGNITVNDTLLTYTIHFQNTGTDTAFTVVVKDSLSPYLDPTTIKPTMSSNPFSFTANNGEMVFTFNHIMLPDSNHSEPHSHGFVQYQVKTLPSLPVGTTILNKARIYFDFNSPVNTNTTSNTIQTVTGISSLSEISLNIYPNPFDTWATVELSRPVPPGSVFSLYDVFGRKVQSQIVTAPRFYIEKSQLPAGVYFYQLEQGTRIDIKGKVVVH
ncbi:MAG: T9SS type A sorting domain-containing protein [Bacteroidia bacterium]